MKKSEEQVRKDDAQRFIRQVKRAIAKDERQSTRLSTHEMAERFAKSPIHYQNPHIAYCIRGHKYTAANTYLDPAGYRHCRACQKEKRKKK